MSRKVYVVNRSVHDFSAAVEFGKLIYLSKGSINRFNTSQIYRKFYPILKSSEKTDYILITGLTIMNLVAAFIFAIKHRRLNLLLFKSYRGEKEYLERILIGDDFDRR
ncbi:hypothetical protein KAX02_13545 [candidate division WOR-3 bacterium]|nr:hypothetical protein [candidate division WOR-3 bacterium]